MDIIVLKSPNQGDSVIVGHVTCNMFQTKVPVLVRGLKSSSAKG